MISKKINFTFFCIMVAFLFLHGNALAHKVTVFAWVEGDTVLGDAKFSGGKKAQNSEVIVYDPAGKELLRTKTDDKGEFSFPIPAKTAMRIELLAGMGHKAEWTIPLDEVDQTTAETKDTADASTAPLPEPAADIKSGQVAASAGTVDTAQLEAIVEKAVTKALNRKITPLTKMVADLEQKGPSINEIIGGIGYIFGLMGVAIYFSSRRKNRP